MNSQNWSWKPLTDTSITIVGTGLMGASLALALRGKVKSLHGVDVNPQHLQDAAHCFDQLHQELNAESLGTDVIVLATPVRTIQVLLHRMSKYAQDGLIRPGTLILDLGSTKRDITAAMDDLPESLLAVGGHPMCGKETSGPQTADGAIYDRARFVLCATKRSTPETIEFCCQLAEAIGARPLLLDAKFHDASVAAISHVPYLISAGLVGMVMQAVDQDAGGDDVAWKLASTGFKDTSRLAASDVTMMADIVESNREAVFHALDLFGAQIEQLKLMLANSHDLQLRATLEQIRAARKEWEAKYFKK
ncbi:MAG: prephenate dehydrogenase/arogenate dehydrogenase family protein [Anaerolineae bacterium]